MIKKKRESQWWVSIFACCLVLATAVLPAASAIETPVSLTPEEHSWLSEHPVIRLAPDPDFPPIEFIDEDGNYHGIAADYAALVERKLGIKFTLLMSTVQLTLQLICMTIFTPIHKDIKKLLNQRVTGTRHKNTKKTKEW